MRQYDFPMVEQGEAPGAAAAGQSSKTRVAIRAAAQVATVVFTGVLSWYRHGPVIGVTVIVVGSIAFGGAPAHAWLSRHGIIRPDARKSQGRRASVYLGAALALLAVEWCCFVAVGSGNVLHDTVGVIVVDAFLAVLLCAFGLIRRLPWIARRADRIRLRRASPSEEPPELYNSGW